MGLSYNVGLGFISDGGRRLIPVEHGKVMRFFTRWTRT